MRLPEVADRLRELAHERGVPELETLANHIRRRTAVRRAEPTSDPVTPSLKRQIREMAQAHPEMPFARIAEIFNVNIGRVSEAIRGKRQ